MCACCAYRSHCGSQQRAVLQRRRGVAGKPLCGLELGAHGDSFRVYRFKAVIGLTDFILSTQSRNIKSLFITN
jgi:hypothetical protein